MKKLKTEELEALVHYITHINRLKQPKIKKNYHKQISLIRRHIVQSMNMKKINSLKIYNMIKKKSLFPYYPNFMMI